MNRKQRRNLMRNGKKSLWKLAVDKLNALSDDVENWIHDGDKVRLNVKQITERGDYAKTQAEYRDFVESSEGRVFTARLCRKRPDGFSAVIELVEEPRWMFWHGDLIRVQSEG